MSKKASTSLEPGWCPGSIAPGSFIRMILTGLIPGLGSMTTYIGLGYPPNSQWGTLCGSPIICVYIYMYTPYYMIM